MMIMEQERKYSFIDFSNPNLKSEVEMSKSAKVGRKLLESTHKLVSNSCNLWNLESHDLLFKLLLTQSW